MNLSKLNLTNERSLSLWFLIKNAGQRNLFKKKICTYNLFVLCVNSIPNLLWIRPYSRPTSERVCNFH